MRAPALPESTSWVRKLLLRHEGVLLALIVVENIVFSVTGRNFWGFGNNSEMLRLCAEIGLLAIAMTPVIVTGGIDLSVGSLMGLSAVLFGKLWRDAQLPIGVAALATLGIGALAGGLNAFIITR